MDTRLRVGRRGELAAALTYQSWGFKIVARNWRCRLGEIDLIASKDGLIVFCEVKTRCSRRFGSPAEAVTYEKRRRLRRLAEAWMQGAGEPEYSYRFDVVSVLCDGPGEDDGVTLSVVRGAF